MRRHSLCLLLAVMSLSFMVLPTPSQADEGGEQIQAAPFSLDPPSEPPSRVELDFEFDAYYTNAGLFIPLSREPMRDLGEQSEVKVYESLLRNLARPKFLLAEAAVFPMPVLGTYLKKNHPGFYSDAGNGKFNLIESITAGFQEPYAFSLFFGDVVRFSKKGQSARAVNKGYMGVMVSYAPEHIKNNVLVEDNSVELEWKLKGDRIFDDEKLSWSFRLGTKIHDHPDIANVGYIGIRRSNLDFNADCFSWFKNSSIEVKWDVALRDGELLRQEYVVGKRFPLRNPRIALTLDVGLIWQSSHLYSGALRSSDLPNYLLVFRPNIKF